MPYFGGDVSNEMQILDLGVSSYRGVPGGMRNVGGEGREGRCRLYLSIYRGGPTRHAPLPRGLGRGAAD